MNNFISLETPYGRLVAWVDILDGVVQGIDIQRFTPSDKMRHKIISEYRAANRKPRSMRRGVYRNGEVLESEESNGTEE